MSLRSLAASSYSASELEQICLYDVAPIVYRNLLSVAGEWAGFDKTWLANSILKRRRRWWRPMDWLTGIGIGKILMCHFTGVQADWQEILKRVERIRADG